MWSYFLSTDLILCLSQFTVIGQRWWCHNTTVIWILTSRSTGWEESSGVTVSSSSSASRLSVSCEEEWHHQYIKHDRAETHTDIYSVWLSHKRCVDSICWSSAALQEKTSRVSEHIHHLILWLKVVMCFYLSLLWICFLFFSFIFLNWIHFRFVYFTLTLHMRTENKR